MSLENRVTIVTGATGSLGRVVARRFAEHGARLALVSRDAERLQALVRELRLPEDRALIHASDLRNAVDAQAAASAVLDKFGRAEILLHLVGGWEAGKPVEQVDADEIAAMLEQHLWTTFHMVRAFVPHLRANQWGRVLAVSSPQAFHPSGQNAPYSIAKAAQQALLLTLASEANATGVTANVLLVRTIDVNHERDRERTAENAGWTTPEEIAGMMVYLCSKDAGEINGAQIPLYPLG
ncbi:MAG: SDR family oxidoreductase [Chloroflexi bacterium]|nr:SDR family oxidoreductase [Chloroflexota bacterium]